MSIGEINRFEADMKANEALHDEARKCGADPARVVALANAKGYAFTLEELLGHVKQRQVELDEKQLDRVAGGVAPPDNEIDPNTFA